MLKNKQSLAVAALALLALIIWIHAIRSGSDVLSVTFLDVGEGLCTVIKSPSGKIIVADCGSSSWGNENALGSQLVAPYLQRMGYNSIDVAILSHPHSDHLSGFPGLLKSKPARMVLDIGAKHASPQHKRFLQEISRSHAIYRIAHRGQLLDMGDGIKIQVLNPSLQEHYLNLNDNSIGLRITYKGAAIVLASDMGSEAEEMVLKSKMPLRAQVMQVGHHGSAFSTSPEWLAAIKPKVAVISCGRNNRYNHPSQETIERLEHANICVYRTDRQGAVTVTTDGSTINVETVKPFK